MTKECYPCRGKNPNGPGTKALWIAGFLVHEWCPKCNAITAHEVLGKEAR